MPKKKISPINEEFDPRLLVTIARKNSLLLALFLLISGSTAFIILRYSQPIYEANSIIQLSLENDTRQILGNQNSFNGINEDKFIASSTELIRSRLILDRVVNLLPLEVSYYIKGDILTNELYGISPFEVEFKDADSTILDVPIMIEFQSEERFQIRYSTNGFNYTSNTLLNVGNWTKLPHVSIHVKVKSKESIRSFIEDASTNNYFFQINNRNKLKDHIFNQLTISVVNSSARTIKVSFKDPNSSKAAAIVNTICSEFNGYDLEKNTEASDKIIQFIDRTIFNITKDLTQSEGEIEKFKIDNAVINADHKADVVVSRIDILETQYQEAEFEVQLVKNIIRELDNNPDFNQAIANMAGVYGNSEITYLIKDIQLTLQDLNQLKRSSTEKSESFIRLQSKLQLQQRHLKNSLKELEEGLVFKTKNLSKLLSRYKDELGRLPSQQAEANRLMRVYGINEKFYGLLLERKAEFAIMKAGYIPKHVVLESAKSNMPPVSPKKVLIVSACLAIGFVSGFLLILIRYLLYNEINALEEVGHYTDAALLGIVPKYKREIPISQLLVDKNPKSIISEAFRSIRTNLQFISNTEGAKLVAVTSTISGEGKTFNAINLAGVIAFSGKKVVILDLDMRKPKIHLGFNAENNHGISTILIGKDKAEDCITHSTLQNLHFITAGPIPPNPAELIISPKMEELINWLKTVYEIIIIDLPPVGIVSDGVPIMQKADYPLYILRANYSRKMFIAQINKLISENKISNLSIILNGVEMSRLKYGYGYGYSYGYGYGYGYSYGYGYYEDDTVPPRFADKVKSLFSFKKG
jgi:capsular exopolysaccharide synthesis family protein